MCSFHAPQQGLAQLQRQKLECQKELPADVTLTPENVARLPNIQWEVNGTRVTVQCSSLYFSPPPPPPRPKRSRPTFDWQAYLDYNSDVPVAGVLDHYKTVGHSEVRIASRIPVMLR